MKKLLLITAILVMLLSFLCSCSKKEEPHKELSKAIDINALLEDMTKAAGDLPDMTTFSSKDEDAQSTFNFLCDLNYEKVDSFLITYASEATSEEIFIIHLKDANDIPIAKSSLENRIKARRTAFNTYLPTEVAKIDNAQITSYGNYIALIICPTTQSTVDAFQQFFTK